MPEPSICITRGVVGGDPVIGGTRIPVAAVVGLFTTRRLGVDKIVELYPDLTVADVEHAIRFSLRYVERTTFEDDDELEEVLNAVFQAPAPSASDAPQPVVPPHVYQSRDDGTGCRVCGFPKGAAMLHKHPTVADESSDNTKGEGDAAIQDDVPDAGRGTLEGDVVADRSAHLPSPDSSGLTADDAGHTAADFHRQGYDAALRDVTQAIEKMLVESDTDCGGSGAQEPSTQDPKDGPRKADALPEQADVSQPPQSAPDVSDGPRMGHAHSHQGHYYHAHPGGDESHGHRPNEGWVSESVHSVDGGGDTP